MTEQNTNQADAVAVSVARQPIFDQDKRLWGYELFCVGNASGTFSGVPLDEDVAVNIAASSGVGLQYIMSQKKRMVVSLNEKSILDLQAYVLPPQHTTVQVSEDVFRSPAMPERIKQLHDDGFQIGVKGFSGAADCDELYGMADVVSVEVRDLSRSDRSTVLAAAKTFKVLPLACMVEDADTFSACQELGFDLFQGAFSKAPEIVPMRKLSSNQVTRFQLLELIQAKKPDLQLLTAKIQSDVSISFRLLTYLNSASFGFTQKIKSISHAVTMLGWLKIKNWLRVVLLSDMSQGNEKNELLQTSAQRARFLELIAEKFPFWGFEPESLHMLGLFSLLDTMIGTSMEEIVKYLPMESKLKGALCKEANNEYLPLLLLAQYFEEARWPEAELLVQQLNLDDEGAKSAFQEAVDWATELTSAIDVEPES